MQLHPVADSSPAGYVSPGWEMDAESGRWVSITDNDTL